MLEVSHGTSKAGLGSYIPPSVIWTRQHFRLSLTVLPAQKVSMPSLCSTILASQPEWSWIVERVGFES